MSIRGVMNPPVEMLTDDGYDLQFGTNVVGHFYFTKLVMPALLAAATTSSDGTARVVNTASNAHWLGRLNYNTFRDSPARRKMHSWVRYGQSKTVSLVFVVSHPSSLDMKRAILYFPPS
jgi:NAD(P)-dependent dehydrogenase (short-subunit alcohol dehydrogenase family)